MSTARASSIALHVEAAKRLLHELESQADAASRVLGRENGASFFDAIEDRGRTLEELTGVVDALAQERAWAAAESESDPEAAPLVAEVELAAAAALRSHEDLVTRTRRERDRLAVALRRSDRPDAVANQYAVATSSTRPLRLSVTG
jgi:hypothetical protein